MFKDFKVELRNDLGQDIKSSMEQLRSDLTEKQTSLQQDVDSVGTRVLDLEGHHQDQEKTTAELKDVNSLRDQLSQAQLKTEDLENRARRENLRIRDLEEGAEGPDLGTFLEGLFAEILSPQTLKIKLERIHRVGGLQAGEKKRPETS